MLLIEVKIIFQFFSFQFQVSYLPSSIRHFYPATERIDYDSSSTHRILYCRVVPSHLAFASFSCKSLDVGESNRISFFYEIWYFPVISLPFQFLVSNDIFSHSYLKKILMKSIYFLCVQSQGFQHYSLKESNAELKTVVEDWGAQPSSGQRSCTCWSSQNFKYLQDSNLYLIQTHLLTSIMIENISQSSQQNYIPTQHPHSLTSSEQFQVQISSLDQQTQQNLIQQPSSSINELIFKNRYPQLKKQSENIELSPQRLNYKQLLKRQIEKNKRLQKELHSYQKRSLYSSELVQKLKEQNELLLERLQREKKIQKPKIKEIQQKIIKTKPVRTSAAERQIRWIKSEDKKLRQNNIQYTDFIRGLSESLLILNGKKPESVKKIWLEWKKILQEVNYYRCQYGRIGK